VIQSVALCNSYLIVRAASESPRDFIFSSDLAKCACFARRHADTFLTLQRYLAIDKVSLKG
jgi:hypothetical protein